MAAMKLRIILIAVSQVARYRRSTVKSEQRSHLVLRAGISLYGEQVP